MEKKRVVDVYRWQVQSIDKKTFMGKERIGTVVFHQFGCDFEEFEDGPGNFTTAIIEMPTGEVKNIPVALIKFQKEKS